MTPPKQLFFLLVLALLSLWVGHAQFQGGKFSWESRGDAHFYAASAEHLAEKGENRWFEIYPIALQEGRGTTMAFGYPAQAWVASWWIKAGWSPAEATLLTSVLAFVLLSVVAYALFLRFTGSALFALSVASLTLLLPELQELTRSGGSDTLSQWLLLMQWGTLVAFSQRPTRTIWLLALCIGFIASFTRPHNFILLLLTPMALGALGTVRQQLSHLLVWMVAVTATLLARASSVEGSDVVFPYAFSFLVNTPNHPGHEIFRTFFPTGLMLSTVLEREQDLMAKVGIGWAFLKQYWPGWSIQLLILGFTCLRPTLRWAGLPLFFMAIGVVLLSMLGHLVPRYWTVLQALTLCSLSLMIWDLFSKRHPKTILALAVLGVLVMGTQHFPRPHEQSTRELNPPPFPEAWKGLQPAWASCDIPAQLIDHLKVPILLLPQNPREMERIHTLVRPIHHIFLSPRAGSGELSHWLEEEQTLQKLGFTKSEAEGWILWQRPSI